MKKSALTFLILVLVASSPAFARLGESDQELKTRFGEGKPAPSQRLAGAQTIRYMKNGFRIDVVVHQGKSIWEIYSKQVGTGPFPEADIENLLNGYKEPKDPKDPKRTWRFDRKEERWEISGKPKYVAFRMPGHGDFFSIKDIEACEALEKGASSGSKGL